MNVTATTPADLGRGRARDRDADAAPQLFVALECERPLAWPSRHLLAGVGSVILGRGETREAVRRAEGGIGTLELRLADRLVSTQHARIFRLAGDRFLIEDCGSKNGTFLNGAPIKRAALMDGDVIEVGRTLVVFRGDRAPVRPAVADLDGSALEAPAPGLETFVAELSESFAALARVARSSISVLLLGDTGTGKEVVARAVHALSRRPGSFVAVNCGALPAALVEASIFGHKKGAFSGAVEDRPGLVRSADKGTLFLDEIGELPRASQVAFLRVLQEQEVVAVGDSRPQRVDLRLVSATHRSVDELVKTGEFREDFFARISGLNVRLPPLGTRREDLGLLVRALLPRVSPAGAERTSFTPRAARALFEHGWPLNVRELEKCLGTAAVLADGIIDLEHLPEPVRGKGGGAPARAAGAEDTLPPDDRRLRDELVARLTARKGNISAVAREMGKGRMQVHRWLKRFALELERFRR